MEEFRKRPKMYIGEPLTAHTSWPCEILKIVTMPQPWENVESADLTLSPTQFSMRIRSGLLAPEIEQAFFDAGVQGYGNTETPEIHDWLDFANRHTALLEYTEYDSAKPWRRFFGSNTGPLLHYVIPVDPIFCHRVFISVKTSRGSYAQLYVDRDPTGPPSIEQSESPYGLIICAELDTAIFPGLPFSPQDGERLKERFPDIDLQTQWHDQDDIFPAL